MSEIAIRVENLGKSYQIGQSKSGDLRESFSQWFNKIKGRKNGYANEAEAKEFWALKDVNFEVRQGEAVGIIGRNGAGKSTLLKILSRITQPTKGRFEINGRVSSLLEVGTGFHPELSGRENIFLNGTILGMSRQEVKAKFNEIVAFSGVERFIDTPVKHYSSGMKVRLAFSVAAHLEPELLIIDEVLAVGDADFQKKCLGKMDEVSKQEGRTVLFVSHNMGAVKALCTKGIFLKDSTVKSIGTTDLIIADYLKENINSSFSLQDRTDREGNGSIKFESVEILDKDHSKQDTVLVGQDMLFRLYYSNKLEHSAHSFKLDVGINNNLGDRICWVSTELSSKGKNSDLSKGYFDLNIKKVPFAPGTYSLTLYLVVNDNVADWVREAFYFTIESGVFYESAKVPVQGQFFIEHEFIC